MNVEKSMLRENKPGENEMKTNDEEVSLIMTTITKKTIYNDHDIRDIDNVIPGQKVSSHGMLAL